MGLVAAETQGGAMITILKPMMRADTGSPEVGLACYKVEREDFMVKVEITYTTKDGRRLWPHKFEVSRRVVEGCRCQVVKGMRLYIVPLGMMKELAQ